MHSPFMLVKQPVPPLEAKAFCNFVFLKLVVIDGLVRYSYAA